jgi:hypothetical protein
MNKKLFFDFIKTPSTCFFVPKPYEAVFLTEYPEHRQINLPVFITNDNRACFGNYSEKIVTYHP